MIYGTRAPDFMKGNARFGVVVVPGLGDCKFDVEHPTYLVDDPPGKSDGFYYLWLGDLNGDGEKDLLTIRTWRKPDGDTGEFVLLYHQPNGTWTEEVITPSNLGVERLLSHAQVGDIDGDGGVDLLVYELNESPTTFSLSVARRSKEGKLLGKTPGWTVTSWDPRMRDLDGDGRAEVFSFSPSGVRSWGGSGWISPPLTLPKFALFGDINQDGLDDMVTGEAVWFNEGKGKYKETPWPGADHFHGLFDLDLDGNLDWHEGGSWHRGDGFGHYDESWGEVLFPENGNPNFDYVNPDVTGDGVYDLVGLGGFRNIVCTPNIGQPILKLPSLSPNPDRMETGPSSRSHKQKRPILPTSPLPHHPPMETTITIVDAVQQGTGEGWENPQSLGFLHRLRHGGVEAQTSPPRPPSPCRAAGGAREQPATTASTHTAPLLFPFSLSSPRCPPGRGGSGG